MNMDGGKRLAKTVAGAALATASLCAQAGTEIPEGKWSFTFTDARGQSERPIRVYTYRPRQCGAKCPMVIVLHGMRRNASEYRDFWVPAAEQYGLLVVAPHFTRRQWPGEASYNLGDVAKQPDPERWTYAAVEHLFDEVRGAREDYVLFGHSAGAQFAQRLGLLRPGHRARVIAAGNAGYYLWPEWRKDRSADPFPYSLVESPVGERELAAALARRFVLLLGDGDTDPKHPQLNRKPGALRQGAHRFERGENFFKQATAAARELGVEFAWELHEVAGVAHDGEAMSRHAAKVLFGKP